MQTAIWLIRLGAALNMVPFGIHQMVNPEVWEKYLPEAIKKMSPLSPSAQMRLHALGNIVFGLFLLSGLYPLVAAWVALIWYLTILPFAFWKDWTVGVRDLGITLALVSLIFLLK